MPMVGSSSFGLNRGAWTAEEDELLVKYMESHGVNTGGWAALPKKAGLRRSGKSCRFRWVNHLRPNINHGDISPEEEDLIIRLHRLLGNRWSLIAGRLPGRTDNQIKNYWNTHLSTRKSENCEQKREKRGRPSRTKTPRPLKSMPPDFEQYQSNSYEEYSPCSPGLLGFSSFSDFNQSSPDLHWVANSYLDAHIIDLLNPDFSGMIPSELCLTFDAESEKHGLPSC